MKMLISLFLAAIGCISAVTGQSCPAGWIQSSNYCYFFNNKNTATWLEAQTQCQMKMGDLLRIETTTEWNFIKSNMVINPSGNGFWTALNDRDPAAPNTKGTGTWLWGNDEHPSDAVVKAHWDKEPDNNDNEDCVAINIAATLSDEHCSSQNGYICEVDVANGECPFGWLFGPNDCFYVSNVSDPTQLVTWDSAHSICQGMNTGGLGKADLVTLDNPSDSNYFTTNMPTSWSIQTTQKWWTDLTDKQTEGTYQWMNGDQYYPQYVNWTKEPNNIAGREHCGTILQKGTFSDRDCNQPNNYICRQQLSNRVTTRTVRPTTRQPTTTSPRTMRPTTRQPQPVTSYTPTVTGQNCPSGWKQSTIYCYYFNNNQTVTWLESQNECARRMGSLLRIETTDEWNFIKSNMVNNPSGNGFWTALNDRDPSSGSNMGTGKWLWGNDEYPIDSVVKANWEKEPDNNDNEDCVAINMAATLSDEQCSSKMGYICELDLPSNGQCPVGWRVGPNDCFYLSNVTDPTQLMTWDSANAKCQGMNTGGQGTAHLITLDNPADSNFLTVNMPTQWNIQTTQKWWTDLTDKQTEGTYKWMNGDHYYPQYVNWTHEPNNIAGREHCGTILQKGTFSDRNCNQPNNYICRKQQPNKQYTSKFGCGDWERAGHKCYWIHSKPLLSWSDANSHCQSMGARLMKIESVDEMNWLSFASKTAIMSWGGYWIGLSDTSSRWRWTDGSLANTAILIWNQEPDDFSGSEDCGAMGTDGVYSDWNCKNMGNGFICEKPQRSSSCPANWVVHSSSCYYIGSNWLTWQESVDKCNALSGDGTGYLLAINTKDEQTFVLAQLDILTQAPFWFWTSLTDVLQEGVWMYTNNADNTPTSLGLVVWNSEPNNWHGEEHCVATAFGGRLNDAKCGSKSGFICEKYAAGIRYSAAGQSTMTFNKLTLTFVSLAITVALRFNV